MDRATDSTTQAIAFSGPRRIAAGSRSEVALAVKNFVDALPPNELAPAILVFDRQTSKPIELDLRGSPDEVLDRLQPAVPTVERGPGRPKLGVVAREVTLLPRHWDWLNEQPGGASVTLRKLVEAARRANADVDRERTIREAAYRFMVVMAGDLPGFEEASRALFAGDSAHFVELIALWPPDVKGHLLELLDFGRREPAQAQQPNLGDRGED
jgi:uncharacterized protein